MSQNEDAVDDIRVSKPRDPQRSEQRPKIGTFDHCEPIVGKRGYGKTNLAFRRILELDSEAHGAYKIGHTPEPNLTHKIHMEDGSIQTIQIRYHHTIKSLDTGLQRYPDDFHVIVEKNMDDSGKADELLKYSLHLSEAVKKNAAGGIFGIGKKNPTGQPAVPIIVFADELVEVEAAGGKAQGKEKHQWFRRYLVRLRHNHIAFIANIQDPNMKSYLVMSQATKIHCFRVTHQWAINALQSAGFSPEMVKELPDMGKYQFHTFE